MEEQEGPQGQRESGQSEGGDAARASMQGEVMLRHDDDRQDEAGDEGEAFSKETFLTTLRDGEGGGVGARAGAASGGKGKKQDLRSALVANVSGMGRVQDLHGQLKGVVGSLSEKVSDVLKKQENEFLSAYRAHMYNVQKELQELRSKVQNAELELQRDEKIRKLTQERDWFRKEALRLDNYSTAMKKEISFMEDKFESIEEDRSWLEKQLKQSKKQNKLLRTELELHLEEQQQQQQQGHNNRDGISPRSVGSNHQAQLAPPIKSVFDEATAPQLTPRGSMRISLSAQDLEPQGHAAARASTPCSRSKSTVGFHAGDASGGESASAKRMIRQLREQLQKERDVSKGLRAHIVNDRTEKADLEDFFMRCIQDTKRDIARRKQRAKVASSKRAPKVVQQDKLLLEKAITEQDINAIRIQDFAALDRKAVVEKLLADPKVIDVVYGSLFGDGPTIASQSDGNNQRSPTPLSPGQAGGFQDLPNLLQSIQ